MEKINTWIISEAEIDKHCGEICARVAGGAIVVYPTDTVYGIGTTITKPDDIRRIFTIKGRTLRKPMALLIGYGEIVHRFASEVTPEAKKLMETFWPGPLTIVFPVKSGAVPEVINNQGKTVGMRMPDHPTALRLIQGCGGVIATTSANTSELEDAATFEMARNYFEGKVEIMLDGGSSPMGIPSTVVTCTEDGVSVLREGYISADKIKECCGT